MSAATGSPGAVHATPGRVAAVLAAVTTFAVCALIARDGTVPGWEADAFHAVNDLPDALEPVMFVFQLAGLLLVPLGVAVVAAVLRRWRLAAVLVLLVPAKLLVEHGVVKQLVERERPGTTVCGDDPTCGSFRSDVPLEGLSFVSGHAVITGGVVAALWPYLPRRWAVAAVAVAVLNAVARVYLGAHNPLDVVGGAAVGVAVGTLLTILVGSEPSPQLSEVGS